MGKNKKKKKLHLQEMQQQQQQNTQETERKLPKTKTILIILAVLGAIVMGYLIFLHYTETGGAFCNLGEKLSCETVNKSMYSKVLGIPVSILGLIYFIALFLVLIKFYSKETLSKIIFVTIIFLGPSLYLTGVEIFILRNSCIFCELSKLIMISIVIISWKELKPDTFDLDKLQKAIVFALILGLAVFLIHKNTRLKDKYDDFAKCLSEKSLVMYGSSTCYYCSVQREMFGESFKYIKEIECDKEIPGNQALLCSSKNINAFPTWILEDRSGNDVKRFNSGLKSLENLSEMSGCSLPQEETDQETESEKK